MKLKRFIAVDKDGGMYAFEERPKRNGDGGFWYSDGGGLSDNLMDVKEEMPLSLSKRTWLDQPIEVIIDYKVSSVQPLKQKRYKRL